MFDYKIRVNRLFILFLLLIIPFISINGINSIYFRGMQIGMMAFDFAWALLNLKHVKIDLTFLGIFFLFGIILFISNTINRPQDLVYVAFYSIRLILLFAVFGIGLKRNSSLFLNTCEVYLGVLLLINLIYQIYDQDYFGYMKSGNYANFLDADNNLPFYVIPYICIVLANFHRNKKHYGFVLLKIIMAYSTLIKAQCAGGIISCGIMLVLVILFEMGYMKRLDGVVVFDITCLVFYFFVWKAKIIVRLEKFLFGIFNKSLFRARVMIWAKAVDNIKRKFWIGYGTTNHGRLAINEVRGKLWYSHNFYLEIVVQGGIILLLCVLFLILYSLIRMKSYKGEAIYSILIIAFICQNVAFLTEGTFINPVQWIIFLLMYFISDIIEISKEKGTRINLYGQ